MGILRNNTKTMLKYNANVKIAKVKKKKQFITIISDKLKLSLFGRDDTRQTKVIIFTVVSQAEQVPKVQKKKNLKEY